MNLKKLKWHRIAATLEEIPFEDNNLSEITVEGKTICLAKNDDRIFACAAKCPHAGGRMCEGYIDALGNIVCFRHRYKFSLNTGRNTSGEGYYLKTFPVEEREDGIYIGLPAPGLFSFF